MSAATAAEHKQARFSAVERLRDGRAVEIRAFRPSDRAALAAAIHHSSARSLRFRFFAVKRHFSAKEIASFTDVDFVRQVALVAEVDNGDSREIVGAGRYVLAQPGTAEVALALIDAYQGLGIGRALVRHLIAFARAAGLKRLVADVLSDNAPMLAVFRKCGLRMEKRHEGEVVHVTLDLGTAADSLSVNQNMRSESRP